MINILNDLYYIILPAACLAAVLSYQEYGATFYRWNLIHAGRLVNCPMCLGFWTGVIFGGLSTDYSFNMVFFLHVFALGAITSFVSFLIYCLMHKVEV